MTDNMEVTVLTRVLNDERNTKDHKQLAASDNLQDLSDQFISLDLELENNIISRRLLFELMLAFFLLLVKPVSWKF